MRIRPACSPSGCRDGPAGSAHGAAAGVDARRSAAAHRVLLHVRGPRLGPRLPGRGRHGAHDRLPAAARGGGLLRAANRAGGGGGGRGAAVVGARRARLARRVRRVHGAAGRHRLRVLRVLTAMHVEPFTADDLEALHPLLNVSAGTIVSLDDERARMAALQPDHWLLARDDGRPRGFVRELPRPEGGYRGEAHAVDGPERLDVLRRLVAAFLARRPPGPLRFVVALEESVRAGLEDLAFRAERFLYSHTISASRRFRTRSASAVRRTATPTPSSACCAPTASPSPGCRTPSRSTSCW